MNKKIQNQMNRLTRSSIWLTRCIAILMAMWCACAYAETKTVVAEGTSEYCWGQRERALEVARTSAHNDAYRECQALGAGWRFSGNKFPGYQQCELCGKSGEFRCKVTQAVYECVNMQKENEEKAAKARAEKEEAARLAKEKADREKAERETQLKIAKAKEAQERADKEAAAKRAKEKADQELAQRKAKEKADREKADQERVQKIAAEKADKEKADREIAEKKAAEITARVKADRERIEKKPKAKVDQTADKKHPTTEANPIDDAFAKLEKQTGKIPGAKTGSIDDEFEKMEGYRAEQERLRVAALKAKQEREAATQVCESAFRAQESCLREGCGLEPRKTICTEYKSSSNTYRNGDSDSCDARIILPSYSPPVCVSTDPNPDHAKWEACTANREKQCAFKDTTARSVDECVQHRLRLSKAR